MVARADLCNAFVSASRLQDGSTWGTHPGVGPPCTTSSYGCARGRCSRHCSVPGGATLTRCAATQTGSTISYLQYPHGIISYHPPGETAMVSPVQHCSCTMASGTATCQVTPPSVQCTAACRLRPTPWAGRPPHHHLQLHCTFPHIQSAGRGRRPAPLGHMGATCATRHAKTPVTGCGVGRPTGTAPAAAVHPHTVVTQLRPGQGSLPRTWL